MKSLRIWYFFVQYTRAVFLTSYDFLISICIRLQNSKSLHNNLVFESVRFIYCLVIFLATSEDCELPTTGYVDQKEVCYGEHVTVRTGDLASISSVEGTSKVSLLSVSWVRSFRQQQQRRELESKSYNSMVSVLSSTSQCFQNWQHSPYNSLLNQSELFSHFFMSLTFSSPYKNCFQLHIDKLPSVLRPQVLESHGFGFHSISLYCPSSPGTTITLDLSVHGIMNWGCPQKSSCQMLPFYQGRNWAQGNPQLHCAHDSQPMFFPLSKAIFYNSSLNSKLPRAHYLCSQFSAGHDRDKGVREKF